MGKSNKTSGLQEELLNKLFAGTALNLDHFFNFDSLLPALMMYHPSAV
jgi:hypothetical protein